MATRKSAPVAGSVQGPAVVDPAQVAESKPEAPAEAAVAAEPFPREVVIVNETPMAHIVAATFIAPGEKVPVVVRNQDEITRMETDIQHLMELTPAFAALEVQPLRVDDAAAK